MKARFSILTLAGGLVVMGVPAWADAPVLSGAGFTASRYEVLWMKSPFAVATPGGAAESADYALVGIAQFDGVDYVSLVDKKSNRRILVSSGKPADGFTLVSVTRGHGPGDTFAVLQKGGESITLKLGQSPAAGLLAANGSPGAAPGASAFPSTLSASNGSPGAARGASAFPSTLQAANGSPGAAPGASGFPSTLPATNGSPGAAPGASAFPSTLVAAGGSSDTSPPAANGSPSAAPNTSAFPPTSVPQSPAAQSRLETTIGGVWPPPSWTGPVPLRVLDSSP